VAAPQGVLVRIRSRAQVKMKTLIRLAFGKGFSFSGDAQDISFKKASQGLAEQSRQKF
jgi:hypothetical protein